MAHQFGKDPNREPLISWDCRKQALVSNWVDVEDQHFEPPALKLISELVIKPNKGLAPDGGMVAEAEAELAKILDVYEARLAKSKFLASEKYTIADVLHLPKLQSLLETPAKKLIESRPRVNAWCTEILARPAWAKVLDMKQNMAQA
ncbi:glutathione transferase [Sarracenia purpurea var. burkii]